MRPIVLTLGLLIITSFLTSCAYFKYNTEDLVICQRKHSYISEFCTKSTCYVYDECDRLIRTYKK